MLIEAQIFSVCVLTTNILRDAESIPGTVDRGVSTLSFKMVYMWLIPSWAINQLLCSEDNLSIWESIWLFNVLLIVFVIGYISRNILIWFKQLQRYTPISGDPNLFATSLIWDTTGEVTNWIRISACSGEEGNVSFNKSPSKLNKAWMIGDGVRSGPGGRYSPTSAWT